MKINISGTPDEIAEFIFNLQDISIEADEDDANEDVHEDDEDDDDEDDANEDVHEDDEDDDDEDEDEKEVSDADKFRAELQQLLGRYPQLKNIEFKTGELTIARP